MTPIDIDKVESLGVLGKELIAVLLMEGDLLRVDALGNVVQDVAFSRVGKGRCLVVGIEWVDAYER